MVRADRGFQELSAVRLGYQTAAQRASRHVPELPHDKFGAHRTIHNPPLEESDSEDEPDLEDNEASMPRIEEWRMNLTALSQYHNLYFVAYGDQVYVYRPRGPQQSLTAEPILIIDPPQSRQAVRTYSGLLNRYHAHVINHLIVGNLGRKEIVLFACHDGDILAYYTDAIEAAIQNSLACYSNVIKPFFAENVGSSAWGLAIHVQSRLIAVGSNSREVQVFAFALSTSDQEVSRSRIRFSKDEKLAMHTDKFPIIKKKIRRTPEGLIPRKYNFRRILKLNLRGDNVPSVAFGDDVFGEAETVVAKDIRGAIWFLHIWNGTWQRLATVPEEPDPNRNPAGWGVMVLPKNFFKPTRNLAEAFGCPKFMVSSFHSEDQINITETVPTVRDSTVWHTRFENNISALDEYVVRDLDEGEEEDDEDRDESGDEDEESYSDDDTSNVSSRDDIIGPSSLSGIEIFPDLEANSELSPGSDTHEPEGMSLDQPSEPNQIPMSPLHQEQLSSSTLSSPPHSLGQSLSSIEGTPAHLRCQNDPLLPKEATTNRSIATLMPSGTPVLHSNRHSFALLPIADRCPPTYCHNPLRQEFPHDALFPRPLADYDRLNMLACIPELSLVLIASQIGRVALCTITRPVDRKSRLTSVVSMRLELVVPFKHEETAKTRPNFGLLGMAVGPMWGDRKRMEGRGLKPTRFRLMLHYFNHTILSYELSRDLETDELSVF